MDNTFEGEESFLKQKEVIEDVIRQMEKIISDNKRSKLVPHNLIFIFCAYSIGKEKLFLSVAEYFNFKVQVEKNKMEMIKCYSEESVNILNSQVLEIVSEIRNNFNDDASFSCKSIDSDRKKRSYLGSLTFNKYKSEENKLDFNSVTSNFSTPLSRISLEDSILKVISINSLSKDKISKLLENVKCDKVFVFLGTGWKNKTKHYNLVKNNKIIKNGIEIRYVRYSEHSSSDELDEFKIQMNYDKICNTVKNKGDYYYVRK